MGRRQPQIGLARWVLLAALSLGLWGLPNAGRESTGEGDSAPVCKETLHESSVSARRQVVMRRRMQHVLLPVGVLSQGPLTTGRSRIAESPSGHSPFNEVSAPLRC